MKALYNGRTTVPSDWFFIHFTSFLTQVVTVFFLYHSSGAWKTSKLDSSSELPNSQSVEHGVPSSGSGIPFAETNFVTLKDDERPHFKPVGAAPLCYLEGTNVDVTLSTNSSECRCRTNYFGRECGIPASVWHRTLSKKYSRWPIKPRKVPRRIIHGVNINHEIDFFRIRLEELQVKINQLEREPVLTSYN